MISLLLIFTLFLLLFLLLVNILFRFNIQGLVCVLLFLFGREIAHNLGSNLFLNDFLFDNAGFVGNDHTCWWRCFLNFSSKNVQTFPDDLSSVFNFVNQHIFSLVPVFWRLWNFYFESIQFVDVNSFIPDHTGVFVLNIWRFILDSIFFQKLEERFVSSNGYWPNLVVVPLIFHNIFNVWILVSPEERKVILSACFAHKCAEPNQCVRCQIFFAVNAVFIVWYSQFFLQIFGKFWLLRQWACLKYVFLLINRCGSHINIFLRLACLYVSFTVLLNSVLFSRGGLFFLFHL